MAKNLCKLCGPVEIADTELEVLITSAMADANVQSSAPRSIACEDVREGDFIYDGPPTAGRMGSWMRVKAVDPPDEKDNVAIHGTRWTTCGHRRQGIAVKRGHWNA